MVMKSVGVLLKGITVLHDQFWELILINKYAFSGLIMIFDDESYDMLNRTNSDVSEWVKV